MQNNPLIKVKLLDPSIELPQYETASSAGMDIRAYLPDGAEIISPQQTKVIGTGLFFEIPQGYEVQVRPRSGLAAKNGITVLNTPGTIDADYRGEIKVILINHSNKEFKIEHQMRIAQIVVAEFQKTNLEIVTDLSSTTRGSGGFGSTGTQ